MAKNPFESQDQVTRVWPVLDGIARRAWERPSVDAGRKRGVHNAAGKFWAQLLDACRDLPQEDKRESRTEPPRGLDVDKGGWSQFARDELVDMIGREDIRSVADAFLKTKSLLRALQGGGTAGHQRFLFRGQRDIAWPLLPRKARALRDAGWTPPERYLCERRLTRTLPEELESLADFHKRWDSLEGVEDVDRGKQLPEDHPEWWFRMQHYDTEGGTRLLDVTTSLTAALLFACVDWASGVVDETTDGIVYLWAEGNNGNVDDFLLHQMPSTADGLFSQYPDAPVFILNPPHNERSKAQSGAFLWWPRFWDDPPYGAPYYLRVVASAKSDIVRDLLSMGFGPKEAVRGIKGLENERSLRAQLGLPRWEPLQLRS
ncbi:MAG: FRG domain-containing protein [Candidatus Methylomirabilales bacterium]